MYGRVVAVMLFKTTITCKPSDGTGLWPAELFRRQVAAEDRLVARSTRFSNRLLL